MSYAAQQKDPRGLMIGVTAVVGFHIILGYGLANGLGRKVMEVLKAPLEVSLIEPVKPAPPPPPPPPKPQVVKTAPKLAPPPPAYVPPVETPVAPPPQPVIAATAPEPAPPAPPAAPAPAPVPAAPPVVDIGITCANHVAVRSQVAYPPQAERMGLSGDVVVDFTVAPDGSIKNVAVTRSSNPVFNAAATAAVAKLKCSGQGQDVRVRLPFAFRLDA